MTGILIIDKPAGITSFGVVAKVRKTLQEKKVGHSGTLDPMATGVMTVLIGGATRFCEMLPSHDKAYEATLRLGTVTDTLDATGKVLEERKVTSSARDFENEAKKYVGEITQVPPMYSAVSVNGRRLYELARNGETVERPERKVTIYKLGILEEDESSGEYKIYVECSSGTYIRTLVSDIGEALGCGAVLTGLRRVKANGFNIACSITPDELKAKADAGELDGLIIPVDKAFSVYPGVTVTEAQAKRFSNGGGLMLSRVNGATETGVYRVYGPDGTFLGLGENDGSENLLVKRVYVET